jgi:hypothetical protein
VDVGATEKFVGMDSQGQVSDVWGRRWYCSCQL